MTPLITSTLAAAALALSSGTASAGGHDDRAAIEALLATYERALNASDADTVMTLYTEDGVFMPQHSLPNVGERAVRAAYDAVFRAITLNIAFRIDEIETLGGGWAFARTRSAGTVTINASGQQGPEANQELFLLTKSGGGEWKIAHYIFSTTNPPRP